MNRSIVTEKVSDRLDYVSFWLARVLPVALAALFLWQLPACKQSVRQGQMDQEPVAGPGTPGAQDNGIRDQRSAEEKNDPMSETGLESRSLHPPLDPPLVLTGTTGEYRRTHFHYGIDLSSQIGDPVYSVRTGYVSRIIYDGYGLGYGIWVMHPDGRQSKYGHLSGYEPELLKRMTEFRSDLPVLLEKRERFDIRFKADQVPVKRGQQIALAGDTGSGPSHLHFEYLQGDVVLNPLEFGLEIQDDRAPLIESLVLIPCEVGASVNGKSSPVVLNVKETSDCGGVRSSCEFRSYEVSAVRARGKLCVQVQYFDPSGKYSRLGISGLRMMQDERTVYESSFRTLKHTGMFRHLVLYSESSRIGGGTQYIHNLFDLIPGHYPFLSSQDHGRIHAGDGEASRILIQMKDAAGNRSELSFQVNSEDSEDLALVNISSRTSPAGWAPYTMQERLKDTMDSSSGVGRPGKTLELSSPDGGLRLEVPPQALTGAVRFQITESGSGPATGALKKLSPVYSIQGRNLDPLTGMIFRERVFALEPFRLKVANLGEKDGLYRITDSGALFPVAYSREGKLTGFVRKLERYILLRDESPPVIRNIPELRTSAGKPLLLSLRYFADYGTGVNVSSLNLDINGKPALAEWDPDRYGFEIFYPEEILKPGRYTAKITVKDYAGNESSVRRFEYVVK